METLNYQGKTYRFTEEQIDDLLDQGVLDCFEGDIVPNIEEPAALDLTEDQEQQIIIEWEQLKWVEKPVYKKKVLNPDGGFSDMTGAITKTILEGTKQVKELIHEEFDSFSQYRLFRKNELTKKKRQELWLQQKELWEAQMEPYRLKEVVQLPRGFQPKEAIKKEVEKMIGKPLSGVIGFDGDEIIYISSDEQQQIFADCSEDLATKLM